MINYEKWINSDIQLLKVLNKFCTENKKKYHILATTRI